MTNLMHKIHNLGKQSKGTHIPDVFFIECIRSKQELTVGTVETVK